MTSSLGHLLLPHMRAERTFRREEAAVVSPQLMAAVSSSRWLLILSLLGNHESGVKSATAFHPSLCHHHRRPLSFPFSEKRIMPCRPLLSQVLPQQQVVAAEADVTGSSLGRDTTTDKDLQRLGFSLAARFNVTDMFCPVGWWNNCHAQTIGGYLLRNATLPVDNRFYYVPRNDPVAVWTRLWGRFVSRSHDESNNIQDKKDFASFWDSRERIATPDGDWFHADTKYADNIDDDLEIGSGMQKPIVLLLHGLASSSMSPVAMDMASAVVQYGNMDCICLNFRGCSGIPNEKMGGYHLGFTDDLRLYLDRLRKQRGGKSDMPPIYLAGFSLGANVALKCLGELGVSAVTDYNIVGAVALCAPLDQTRNSATLALPGINRMVYTNNLLRSLQTRSLEQWNRFFGDNGTDKSQQSPMKVDMGRAMEAKTITEFDDAFIAPVYGFADCWDYYRQTSSIHYLDRIVVPTLILNAKDDPFFDPSVWPVDSDNDMYQGAAPIRMIRSEHGGHLGYVFHQVDDLNDPRLDASNARSSLSWSADQMGRFLQYLHESSTLR